MDKVRSFARVIVGVVAIFFSVKVLVMMITPVGIILNQRRLEGAWLLLVHLVICAAGLILLQYFGVFRPQKVVDLVTSHIEPAQPVAQIHWLPAAYRLVCMFAGLYCVYGVLYRGMGQIGSYYLGQSDSGYAQTTSFFLRPDQIATTLVLLVLGVYLLAGAPHFVRWHLKRTMRFCAENPVD